MPLRRVARSWRIAVGGLAIAAMSVQCGVFVDSSGLTGGGGADGALDASGTADAPSPDDGASVSDTGANDANAGGDAGGDATIDADGAADAKTIPDGAVVWAGNGHAYLVVVRDGGVSWDIAKQGAVNLGGHLATIASSAENTFVSSLANQNDSAWAVGGGPYLGGYQPFGSSEPDGGWSWVTGEPWGYAGWAPSEPTGGFLEDYVQYEARFSPFWNDVASGAPNSYVVEFE